MTSEARQVRLSIPAKPEYIALCRLALAGLTRMRPLSEETVADLKLALTEACTNSVRHAYRDGRPGHVEVVYDLQHDRLVVDVLDDGEGFRLGEPAEGERELDESGLGLTIIRSLTDEVEVDERENGRGSRLRFVKLLSD
jgi:serine/threonine-protein kinase RsbW